MTGADAMWRGLLSCVLECAFAGSGVVVDFDVDVDVECFAPILERDKISSRQ